MGTQRGPNGRALKKDGTERKERKTLTPYQRAQKRRESRAADMRGLGRSILKEDDVSSKLLTNVGKAKAWAKQAKAIATQEQVDARKAYYLGQIDSLQERHEAAVAFLDGGGSSLSALDTLEENIGEDIYSAMSDGQPSKDKISEICAEHFTSDVVSALADAGDPEKDPFKAWRKDTAETESDDNTDSLDD